MKMDQGNLVRAEHPACLLDLGLAFSQDAMVGDSRMGNVGTLGALHMAGQAIVIGFLALCHGGKAILVAGLMTGLAAFSIIGDFFALRGQAVWIVAGDTT